ncbi:hypothetical protein [Fusobacterium polymorphum]
MRKLKMKKCIYLQKNQDIAKALSCNIEALFKHVEFQEDDDDYIFIKKY